jgi:molybdate/tungstate transport system permease protein
MATRTEPVGGRADALTVALVLGGLLVAFYVVPLLSLVVARPPGTVLAALGSGGVQSAAVTSLVTAAASTALATVGGVPLAYWLARTDGPLATAVGAAVVLPLVLPPVVAGMVLLTLVGPDAVLARLVAAGGVALTRSLAGVVLAQTFVASPFVVVTATAAFRGVDPRLEHASRSLGKSRLASVRRVTLPLAWPGILGGITLAFARAMGEFGATLVVAYYPRTLPVAVWDAFVTEGLDAAFPVAVVLLAVSVATIATLHLLGASPIE